LPVDLRDVAVGDHPKDEREIESNADVPADQNAGHAAKLFGVKRQQLYDAEADEDREQESRPRQENAQRQRPFPLGNAGLGHDSPVSRFDRSLKPGAKQ